MKTYETMLEAITDLNLRGYTYDFNLQEDCIFCQGKNQQIAQDEFHIAETHRFENNSDPDENAVVYAIDSPIHNIRGILVNSYGIYADSVSSELIKKFT